jgi:hypothetical protein
MSARFGFAETAHGRPVDHAEFFQKNSAEGLASELDMVGASEAKILKSLVVRYSGWLGSESSHQEVCKIPFALAEDEEAALRARERVECDFSTVFTGDATIVSRSTFYRTTGRPALLAIYSYVAAELAILWRQIKAADRFARLLCAATDSVGFFSALRREEVDALPLVAGGRFKIESQGKEKKERRPWGFSSACVPRKPLILEKDEAHRARGALLEGPPGSGKTWWVQNALVPALREHNPGVEIILATTTRSFANEQGWQCVQQLFKKTLCSERCRARVARSILIVDEVSLADSATLRQIQACGAYRLFLIGDACQLGQAGDLMHLASRMDLEVLHFDYTAAENRFRDGKRMTGLLQYLRALIRRSAHGHAAPPRTLVRRLQEYGVAMGPATPGSTVLAWEHCFVNSYKDAGFVAQTIHSSQGRTIEGAISVVDAWKDLRLLYVAISRARRLEDVVLVPEADALRPLRRPRGGEAEEDD